MLIIHVWNWPWMERGPCSHNGVVGLSSLNFTGHVQVCSLVGWNVNTTDEGGKTLIYWAGFNGLVPLAEVLIKGGADLNAMANDGKSALMWASYKGHESTVEILLKGGADVNAKDNNDRDALWFAGNHPAVLMVIWDFNSQSSLLSRFLSNDL